MPKDKRLWVWAAVSLLGAVLVAWWSMKTPPTRASGAPGASGVTALVPQTPLIAASAPARAAFASPARRAGAPVITPEVERLRARVIESLAAKRPRADDATPVSAKRPPGNLKDHTGELNPETMRILSQEFMPMVEGCYEQAHQRNPKLGGMLALSIELAGAEEFGTIIESVEPAPDINQLADDELIDCVRQSAFSLQLPQPLKSGRAARQLTMPFGEPPPAPTSD